MSSVRALVHLSPVVVLILLDLVNSGLSSGDGWRPVSRINSRRSLEEPQEGETEGRSSSWFPSTDSAEYRVIQKVLDDCIKREDGETCLRSKALTFLDRVGRLQSIPLFAGVSLARQQEGASETPVLSEAEIEAVLPRDLGEKTDRLDQMIYDHLTSFLDSHTLVMDFSEQGVGEGRGRRKKLMGYLMMGLAAAAATVGPLAFKSLAALAFKALVVAKVALVLSSVVAFKKLTQHESHRRSYLEENSTSWPQGRSLVVKDASTQQAHKMAYRAQLQRPITVT